MKKPALSKLAKAKANPRSNFHLHKADAAWGDLMHTVYDKCAIGETVPTENCKGPLEAHHLLNRRHYATRHEVWNCPGLLCSKHHQWSINLSAHFAPLQFAEWLQSHRPDHWQWVCQHKNDMGKPDYKAKTEYLIKLKAEYLNKKEKRAGVS